MQKNIVIIVAGPTASGKSALAVDLAKYLDGVVINADSMQVYQNMPVISAVPSEQDKALAEHKLFEIYPPTVRGNVVDWLNLAVQEIKSAFKRHKTPIVVGGTGLYLDNLIYGTTPIPETPENIRHQVQKMFEEKGLAYLYQELQKKDPTTAQKLSENDTTRIKRAYEVYLATGKPISEWYKVPMVKKIPDAEFFIIKICPSAEELDKRCFERFDKMLQNGALKEVENLYQKQILPSMPAMKALGVPELLEYFAQKVTLEEAVQNAKLHTRQYAKRQRTWFKNKLPADYELKHCYLSADLADILATYTLN